MYMYIYVCTYLVEAMLHVLCRPKPLGLIPVDLVYLQPNLQLVRYIFMELDPIINKM